MVLVKIMYNKKWWNDKGIKVLMYRYSFKFIYLLCFFFVLNVICVLIGDVFKLCDCLGSNYLINILYIGIVNFIVRFLLKFVFFKFGFNILYKEDV